MIYFLIPVYNEHINIGNLYISLTQSLEDQNKTYVFVDDCSTDDTINVLKNKFVKTTYQLIEKSINKGPGDSFNLGFNWIIENSKSDSDIIVTIEGDNTADLTILPKMITIASLGYDLVLASVYAQGGKLEKTTFFRKFLSFFANLILRFLLDIKLLTLSSFYRVYKISLVKKIKENNKTLIEEKGFLSTVEILIKAIKANAKIIEVPTTLLSEKRKGKSKMKVMKTMFEYFRLILRTI